MWRTVLQVLGALFIVVLAIIAVIAIVFILEGNDPSTEELDKRIESLESTKRNLQADIAALNTRVSQFEQASTEVVSDMTPEASTTVKPTATPTILPGSTPRPTASLTARPTSTPRPTATLTLRPTSTSGPTATLTPRPTSTPRPTATQTPRPTSTSRPTTTPTPIVPERVSVTQIFDDYRARPALATEMYEGTTFEVSGEVTNRRGDRIQLHVPGLFTDFECLLVPEQRNLDQILSRRQEVVMKGTGVGKSGNRFTMRNCTFVSPSPDRLRSISVTRVAATAISKSVTATASAAQEQTRVAERATRDAARATSNAVATKERATSVAATATARAKKDASSAAATATATHKGFHCLSLLDGHSRQMNDLIKTYLNDPDSFQARETRIAPEVDGTHVLFVDFTAKNALGGTVRNMATGMIDHDTCEALIVLEIEPK